MQRVRTPNYAQKKREATVLQRGLPRKKKRATSTAKGTSPLLRSARRGASYRAAEALALLQAEDGEEEDDDKEESAGLICRGRAVLHSCGAEGCRDEGLN